MSLHGNTYFLFVLVFLKATSIQNSKCYKMALGRTLNMVFLNKLFLVNCGLNQ